MKYLSFSMFLSLAAFTTARAQQPTARPTQKMIDSIRLHYIAEAAVAYPILRPLSVSTDFMGTSRMRSRLYGKSFFDADSRAIRTTVNASLPLVAWNRNVIGFSMGYMQQWVELSNVKSYDAALPVSASKPNRGTATLALSYAGGDSLFGRPVNYSVTVSGLTSETSSIEKMVYMGSLLFTLKRSPTTALMVGGVVIIDPSLAWPLIPMVNYWHRFDKRTELYIDMPQRLMLRRSLSAKSWLWLGSDISSSVAFMNINNQFLPRDVNYSTFEIKSGLGFEYRIAPKLILGCRGGVLNPISARMFERGEKTSDYFIRNDLHAVPFATVSLSVLPFMQAMMRR